MVCLSKSPKSYASGLLSDSVTIHTSSLMRLSISRLMVECAPALGLLVVNNFAIGWSARLGCIGHSGRSAPQGEVGNNFKSASSDGLVSILSAVRITSSFDERVMFDATLHADVVGRSLFSRLRASPRPS